MEMETQLVYRKKEKEMALIKCPECGKDPMHVKKGDEFLKEADDTI